MPAKIALAIGGCFNTLMDQLQIVKELCSLSPRQGENEIEAAKYIEQKLSAITSKIQVQKFATRVPIISNSHLKLDDHYIDCLGCSF
ncbi:MAG: hypothetical protein ACKPFF_00375, partial [Planktothrix sp.]